MAVDEALLESAGSSGPTTLRFYQWQEATVSLGYFQRLEDRRHHLSSRDQPLVRRATGGGAIIHDHELTYSFSAPITDRVSRNVAALYDTFHKTLIRSLLEWGVEANLCEGGQVTENQPFLCFQRRSAGDVLLGRSKIAGSAQRRHFGAVLQHGSILLSGSPHAPELGGIEDLLDVSVEISELIPKWTQLLSQELDISFQTDSCRPSESSSALQIEAKKFSEETWTKRR